MENASDYAYFTPASIRKLYQGDSELIQNLIGRNAWK